MTREHGRSSIHFLRIVELIGLDVLLAVIQLALIVLALGRKLSVVVILSGSLGAVRHLLLETGLIIDGVEITALVFEFNGDLGYATLSLSSSLSLLILVLRLVTSLPIAPMQIDSVCSLIVSLFLSFNCASNDLGLVEEGVVTGRRVWNEIRTGARATHVGKEAFVSMAALHDGMLGRTVMVA